MRLDDEIEYGRLHLLRGKGLVVHIMVREAEYHTPRAVMIGWSFCGKFSIRRGGTPQTREQFNEHPCGLCMQRFRYLAEKEVTPRMKTSLMSCSNCQLAITPHSEPEGVILVRAQVGRGYSNTPLCSDCWKVREPTRQPHRIVWAFFEEDNK